MPRQARLDTPGTLHHVIVWGIEKIEIVTDNTDRKNFITRLGTFVTDTDMEVYSWALMSNHSLELNTTVNKFERATEQNDGADA